jgi:hypothetical protein
MNKTVYSEKIFYYQNVLDNPQEIIDLLELTDDRLSDNSLISCWHDWTSSNADHQFGYRKTTNPETNSVDEDVNKIYNSLKIALDQVGEDYAMSLSIPKGTQAPISISKYLPNEYMGPHADEGDPRAHFSAVLYLNHNFEGGGLGFPNQDIFIRPTAGSIIVFPSVQPYVHDPKPASEIKYISPAFWFVENSPLIAL